MGSQDAAAAATKDDTIVFNVGGEKFEILEQSVRAKPETLLCTLLDDPGRDDPTKPIFVNGDAKRFRYILDWYRYGSIKLPVSISQEEMHRDLAFYQLPSDTKIAREHPSEFIQIVCKELQRCHEIASAKRKQLASQMGAASTYCFLLEQFGKIMMESVTSHNRQGAMVQIVVAEEVHKNLFSLK